jgi:hypothetical protein
MGTIVWQAGQVGSWNSTRLGRAEASTSGSKFPPPRTTTLDGSTPEEGELGDEPPPPQPASSEVSASAAIVLRVTSGEL